MVVVAAASVVELGLLGVFHERDERRVRLARHRLHGTAPRSGLKDGLQDSTNWVGCLPGTRCEGRGGLALLRLLMYAW